MLNIEKYENELRKSGVYFGLTKEGSPVDCKDINCVDCAFHVGCTIKRMNWLLEECKEPILNEEEKKILNDLIEVNKKLTNSKFLYVSKLPTNSNCSKCYLYLTFEYSNICDTVVFYSDTIFKRMETNKQYSLEELGLC